MSKRKLTLAIMLAVLVICLSACGGSKETNGTDKSSSQSSTVSPSAPAQGASSTVEASLADDGGSSLESSSGKTNRNDTDSAGDAGSRPGSDMSGQGSAAPVPSQKGGDTGADSRTDLSTKNTEPEVVRPTEEIYTDPQGRDNAEVNFNDL